MKLNRTNSEVLPTGIPKPSYDRHCMKGRQIVHIGVGGFHRAHQAFYLEELLCKGLTDWTICGMGVLNEDKKLRDILRRQDHLYTLVVKHPEGRVCPQVIGSIVDYVFMPDDPAAAIRRLADPQTGIISLTITEGGYNFDEKGDFIFDTPDVRWDMEHPEEPKTVFGLLAAALKKRRQADAPVTILSCDNIQHNGDVMRRMLLAYVGVAMPSLSEWIGANVGFPNCMVDRITPVTSPGDIELLSERFGVDDEWPVTCEPFIQWVLEDDFRYGRPAWELAGAQFVADIDPYENIKLRLLNAGHSLLGFFGSLAGYRTVDEAVGDPVIRRALRAFMDDEVAPTLDCAEGIDLDEYKESLICRFANPNIKDSLARICSDSSDKLPKFLFPTIHERSKAGGEIKYCATALAAWCRILELRAEGLYDYPVKDSALRELTEAALATRKSGTPEFLKITAVFGNLAEERRLACEFMERLGEIRLLGIKETLLKLI